MKLMGFPEFNIMLNRRRYSTSLSLILLFFIPAIIFYSFQKSIFYYQEDNSLFIYSCDFLNKFTGRPGGLLEYSGLFLTQGYFSPLLGSLVLSVLFAFLGSAFSGIQKTLSGSANFSAILIIIPSCLLMILQRSFSHLMELNLGFLSVGIWFLYSVRLDKRFRAMMPALFPFFYYLTGSFSFIYLAMIMLNCIVNEKSSSRYTTPLMLIASALVSFLIFREVLFLQTDKCLLFNPLQKYISSGFPPLLFLLTCFIILFPVVFRLFHRVQNKIPSIIHKVSILIIFLSTGFILTESENKELADNTLLKRSVDDRDWNEIIRHHEASPSASIIGQYYYNLALSETGQLCSRLFAGRQDFGAGSLTLQHEDRLIDYEIYYYYATGMINETLHLATESLVRNGYRPGNIKFLIKANMIKGNYKVAGRFINLLKRTLHYRKWAVKYGRMLSDHALINSDQELNQKIRLIPKNDFFIKPFDLQNIESILKAEPGNKTMFEYKMARMLFDKDLETIVKEAGRMKEIGYNYYPRYIEEAIVEAEYRNIGSPGAGYPATESRFRQYINDYKSYGKTAGSFPGEKMKRAWGNTYWYYYDFR